MELVDRRGSELSAAATFALRRAGEPRVEALSRRVADAAGLARALGDRRCPSVLLSDGSERAGVHVLALAPRGRLVARDGRRELSWERRRQSMLDAGRGFDALRALLHALGTERPSDGRFRGGVVVALGHDACRELEDLPRQPEDRDRLPWLSAVACPASLVVDAVSGEAELSWLPDAGDDGGDALPWGLTDSEAEALRAEVAAALDAPEALGRHRATGGGPTGPVTELMDAEAYRAMVGRVHEHLLDGDVYQANVGQRFEVAWRGEARALFERLRELDPAPMSAWLAVPESSLAPAFEIASASPERLVRRVGRDLVTEPIAGTLPLPSGPGASEEEVARASAELRASAKDAAEHVMIVDLHRNDLGIVSTPGTVRVAESMRIDRRAHLVQAVAEIRGELEQGRDVVSVLEAMSPGGCVTGVPKARCLEVIDSVEPHARGFWTGSLGWLDSGGDMDLSVLIRCAWLARGRLAFAAGGGIVVASEAEAERRESLAKARGIREAIESLRGP